MKKILFTLILLIPLFVLTQPVSAHQPEIVTSNPTVVTEPEVSKAYYGTLPGQTAVYTINSDKPFALYVGLLVPNIALQQKNISAVILKNGEILSNLNGMDFNWTTFDEPFGHDSYFKGPEYKAEAQAGKYEIRVTSPSNDNKYSLAIGEIEAFDFKSSLHAFTVIPILKKDFFNKSPIDFILSPLGIGLIGIMYVLAFIFGFLYRFILKKFARGTVRGVQTNIGKYDRWLRIGIAIILLLIAITTTWSMWLLFFSGFALFEGIFSWCGLYAALGRNTCPVE